MNNNTLTTGKVRLSFNNLINPIAYDGSDEAKYSATVLVDKQDTVTLDRLQKAIEEAKLMGKNKNWDGKIPNKVPTPLHDCDEPRESDGEDFPEYCKGCYVFTANSKDKPRVVDRNLNDVAESDIYSGMYVRINMSVYPYAFSGKKGVCFRLNSVQKVSEGEPLGASKPSVSEAFDDGFNDFDDDFNDKDSENTKDIKFF